MGAGSLYWASLMGLQMTFGGKHTLGYYIGFEIQVYNEEDEAIPEHMRASMLEASLDGSRRRVSYKVHLTCTPPLCGWANEKQNRSRDIPKP